MLATILICSYNQAPLLRRALAALARQSPPLGADSEVLVVDDASTDDTAAVCAAAQATLPGLRCLRTPQNRGLADAANLGLAEARGDVVLFTDADCVPEPAWAAALCQALAGHDLVAGAVVSPLRPRLLLCHNIAQFHPFLPGTPEGPRLFVAGANLGVQRGVFTRIGPFEAGRRMAPDTEFVLRARRAGLQPVFCPAARVLHVPEDRHTWRALLDYAASHAAATVLLRQRYRDVLHTPPGLGSPALLLAAAPLVAAVATARLYLANPRLWHQFWTIPPVFLTKVAWCFGAARGLRGARDTGGAP